ncbi:hypothetical protein JKP88DRAFT_349769 [Tribonema minus]|uniref:Uncharacterized protein n=1 Tax=Tribonema minus TaxID=303371 RepID=A0A835YRG6_9STRA|nr:hypothetical protein JKP88DRAFT_349769 [Tribonema minus]
MASSSKVSATVVGHHFIKSFYGEVLPRKPLELHRFYSEQSTFCHAEGNKQEQPVMGLENIKEKIRGLGLADATVDLDCGSVDIQASQNGSILLMVTGAITLRGQAPRQFAQTFLLATHRQMDGRHNFFVLNDVFRLLDTIPEVLEAALAKARPAPAVARPAAPRPPLLQAPCGAATPPAAGASPPPPAPPARARSPSPARPKTPPPQPKAPPAPAPVPQPSSPTPNPSTRAWDGAAASGGWESGGASGGWDSGDGGWGQGAAAAAPAAAPAPAAPAAAASPPPPAAAPAPAAAVAAAPAKQASRRARSPSSAPVDETPQAKSWAAIVTKGAGDSPASPAPAATAPPAAATPTVAKPKHSPVLVPAEAPAAAPAPAAEAPPLAAAAAQQPAAPAAAAAAAAMQQPIRQTAGSPRAAAIATNSLFVKNIDPSTQSSEVATAFERFGTVTQVDLKPRPERCFAFVAFSSPDAVAEAIRVRDAGEEITLTERTLHYELRVDQPARSARGGHRGDRRYGRGFGRGRGRDRPAGDRPAALDKPAAAFSDKPAAADGGSSEAKPNGDGGEASRGEGRGGRGRGRGPRDYRGGRGASRQSPPHAQPQQQQAKPTSSA